MDGGRVQHHLARFDPGQVEDVVDQGEQMPAAVVDGRQSGGLPCGEVAAVASQQLGVADDGVERRPQLVAHLREELAALARQRDGLGQRRFTRRRGFLAFPVDGGELFQPGLAGLQAGPEVQQAQRQAEHAAHYPCGHQPIQQGRPRYPLAAERDLAHLDRDDVSGGARVVRLQFHGRDVIEADIALGQRDPPREMPPVRGAQGVHRDRDRGPGGNIDQHFVEPLRIPFARYVKLRFEIQQVQLEDVPAMARIAHVEGNRVVPGQVDALVRGAQPELHGAIRILRGRPHLAAHEVGILRDGQRRDRIARCGVAAR